MNIKVLFNDEAIDGRFSIGCGFSCLVDNSVLFDTGGSGEHLFHNIKIMGVDISAIDKVVISHDHWDHTGGLWKLLNVREDLKIYSCPGFSKEFKDRVKSLGVELIEIDSFTEIEDSIYVSGEIACVYHAKDMFEQSLYIKTDKGVTIITGCAHPGILKIIEKAKKNLKEKNIYSAFGGFHLKNKSREELIIIVNRFKELGVKKTGPTHCSGNSAQRLFKKIYKNNYIQVKVGQILEI
ncbi:MAG: MBL fold metallo-hydrolase [Candidatus Kaelpia aquatica]|nr:MBL fold metallo-hydrolase [Candidatus Kaelpia aquatica]